MRNIFAQHAYITRKERGRFLPETAPQSVDKSMQTPRIHDIIRIMIPGVILCIRSRIETSRKISAL